MPRGSQLSRQWRLLQLLDAPAGVTVEDAARDLGCAVRTIWRDLRVLEDAGFPIYDEPAPDGRRGLWRIDPAFKARLPVKLTLAELAALLMSRQVLAPLGASVLGPAVNSAFDKISGVLSRDALALLDAMKETVGVRTLGAKLQVPVGDVLPKIQTALVERRTLRMRYHSRHSGEEGQRDVDPYHLTYFEGGLYLVAYCHMRRDVRLFAAERIRAAEMLRPRFEIRKGFDLKTYLDKAWGILQGDLVTVRVMFSPKVARYIRERLWHPSQRFRDLSNGRLEMTLRVADTLEVRRWILGYGTDAEVMEPDAVREALRQEAESLARMLVPSRRPLAAATTAPRSQKRGRQATGAVE
ncbi:MAG TPA: transcriptional regulator [Methylomirabilota bacterium]|nr:transcriptional regulator [Methylomirabilota bacterium]